jgi:hypothetical protein
LNVSAAGEIQGMMRIRLSDRAWRLLIAGVLLFAFVLRSLVPEGFMPASERPFSVEICPEGFPAQLLAHGGHHHHGGGHSYTEHCVFGTACPSGPPSQAALLADSPLNDLAPAAPFIGAPIVVQLVYLPHARGPPVEA